MKKVFILFLILSVNCYAGHETGTVRFNHGQYGSGSTSAGKTFFFLDGGVRVGAPACATFSGGERWVINNDWPAAQLQNSVLLSAVMAGKQVNVRGSDTCDVWGDSETAIDIVIVD